MKNFLLGIIYPFLSKEKQYELPFWSVAIGGFIFGAIIYFILFLIGKML